MELNITRRNQWRMATAVVPKKFVQEIMPVYAMDNVVQLTRMAERWEVHKVPSGYDTSWAVLTAETTYQDVEAFRDEGKRHGLTYTAIADAVAYMRVLVGDFGLSRHMPWAWKTFEYTYAPDFEGIKTSHATGPYDHSQSMFLFLEHVFATNVIVDSILD